MRSRVRLPQLFGMFWRSLFVQGSWNHKAMLGLGFCFSAIPFIKRLFKTPKAREECLRRHLVFFNSHPYYASWCLGAVAKLEEEARRKKWEDLEPIEIFKERLMSPLGSIGDRLFWDGIKPAMAGLGILLALTVGWIAIPLFLILYNIPHFVVRIMGIRWGYRKGFDIVSDLSVRKYQKWFELVGLIGAIAAGLCLIAAVRWCWLKGLQSASAGAGPWSEYGPVAVFISALVLTLAASHYRKSRHLTLVGAALLGVGISLILAMM